MNDIAVVTDSNSGITQNCAKELDLFVIPMPFTIDGQMFLEDINLSQEEFYKKLGDNSNISTSQPAIGSVIELWESLLKNYGQIIHIPMSSGLSTSYESAAALAREYGGRVFVINNQRISVTQRQSALDARELANAGWNGAQIKDYLESVKYDSSIYIMVDTLKYLKRGGRITPAGAAIGSVLNIKPVLQINGEKLDSYAKARGSKQAGRIMIDAIKKDLSSRFSAFSSPERMWLQIAYSYDEAAAMNFKKEVEEEFSGYDIDLSPLSLSVACHIGPGALALACSRKLDCL